jgi:hypothetical protein
VDYLPADNLLYCDPNLKSKTGKTRVLLINPIVYMKLFLDLRLTRNAKICWNSKILNEKKKEEQTGTDRICIVGSGN